MAVSLIMLGFVAVCMAVSLICWALWLYGRQSDNVRLCGCMHGRQSDMLGFVAIGRQSDMLGFVTVWPSV